MAYPQGIATFPGVDQIVSASISVTHGITPAVASMEIAPQTHYLAEGGLLRFQFGEQVIDFPGCKVDYFSMQRNRRGLIWRFTIFDRRWKWRFGTIAGQYNHLDASGDIERIGTAESWEATPQELATFCLEAMGEQSFEVADLPNETRPVIDWDEVNPAGALARLCDGLGCRVVLGFDNVVRIRKVGEGNALPIDNDVQQNSLTINPPEKPKKIGVLCGPTRFQVDFELEAVGVDNDKDANGKLIGTIVPVDDLSYKPAAGWGNEHPLWMFGVADQDNRKLAMQSVFRYYRIKLPVDFVKIMGFDTEDRPYLEYLDEQVETLTLNGATKPRPPVVYGTYCAAHGARLTNEPADVTYPAGSKVDHAFTFDAARGLVMFQEPVYRNTDTAKVDHAEATIYLRTACLVRRPWNRAYQRVIVERQIGEFETETQWIRHDELYHTYIDAELQNPVPVNNKIFDILDAAEAEYRQEYPQTVTYVGLKLIPLDGAIRQATFRVGLSGCTSIYSRNTEQLDRVPSYKERRLVENQAEQQSAYERHLAALRAIAKPHRALWVGDTA